MTDSRVIDNSNDKRYFTTIPNLVDDMELSPFAFRLYVHLKRVAGESGECWQSTRTLAAETGISVGKISTAKKELKNADLITIHSAIQNRPSDTIRIIDIWGRNFEKYQRSPREHRSPHERERSPHERERSPHERERSPHEPINNQLRKTNEEEPIKKNTTIIRQGKNNNNSNSKTGNNGGGDVLPKPVLTKLSKINWTGKLAEVVAIYTQNPELIIAWLDRTLEKPGLKNQAGYFRSKIRVGEMPIQTADEIASDEWDEYQQSLNNRPERKVLELSAPGVDETHARIWENAQRELLGYIPPAAAIKVRGMQLASVDDEMFIFSTHAGDAGWLEGRLTKDLENHLVGSNGKYQASFIEREATP